MNADYSPNGHGVITPSDDTEHEGLAGLYVKGTTTALTVVLRDTDVAIDYGAVTGEFPRKIRKVMATGTTLNGATLIGQY